MSEERINVPSEKQFALSKVKMAKDGGLDVHYEVVETIGNETYTNKYHVESAKDIHPDLRVLFDELTPIMGRVFNITSFLTVVETPEFGATKAQEEVARAYADEIISKNIKVTGVALSGKEENLGCLLSGTFAANGQQTTIKSPRIKFSTEVFGFEEQLEAIIADIEVEVYQFLFKGKKAQLELFGEDDGTDTDN